MFERFLNAYTPQLDKQKSRAMWLEPRLMHVVGYRELFDRFAGCSFNNGLYRLHDSASGPRALAYVTEMFPAYKGRIVPFAYDWLGRQFATDFGRVVDGQPLAMLFEPGPPEDLEIPLPLPALHDDELVDFADEILAADFFAAWSQDHGVDLPLAADKCVGFRVPPFLGGTEDDANLEVTDIEVYWSLTGQLWLAAARLPEGHSVEHVVIDRETDEDQPT